MCFGDLKTSVTCGHCAPVIAQPEIESSTPEISHEEIAQQQVAFIHNLDRAHAELLNGTISTFNDGIDGTIGVPSTSRYWSGPAQFRLSNN